jgi:hypothetical protein
MGVLIGGKPAARMGDNTAHGGTIAAGCPTVLIGDVSMGALAAAVMVLPHTVMMGILQSMPESQREALEQAIVLTSAAQSGAPFCEECARARANQ